MGFDLGLAASAYQGAMAERRRINEDAFIEAQRDYQRANMDEQTSRRGYRDNAAGLADDQVQASRSILPHQTENTRRGLDLAGSELDRRQEQLPVTQATANDADEIARQDVAGRLERAPLANQAALSSAKSNVLKADDVHAWDEARHTSNAGRIDEEIAGDELKAQSMRDKVYASIYASGSSGNIPEKDIVARFNSVARAKTLFPDLSGKTVSAIKRVGDNMELHDADGKVIKQVPIAQMKAAYDAQSGKGDVVKVANGENLYSVRGGKVQALTDNKKTYAPQGGDAMSRHIDALMKEDSDLSYADALRKVKETDPTKLANQLMAHDFRIQTAATPEERQKYINENRATVGLGPLVPGGGKPGLDAVDDATRAKINKAISLK